MLRPQLLRHYHSVNVAVIHFLRSTISSTNLSFWHESYLSSSASHMLSQWRGTSPGLQIVGHITFNRAVTQTASDFRSLDVTPFLKQAGSGVKTFMIVRQPPDTEICSIISSCTHHAFLVRTLYKSDCWFWLPRADACRCQQFQQLSLRINSILLDYQYECGLQQ